MYLDNSYFNNFFYGYYGRNCKRLLLNVSPNTATTVFSGTGIVKTGSNYVWAPVGTAVGYNVSNTGYVSTSGTVTVTANETLPVILEPVMVTLTVNPTPSDATVTLTATGYAQSGNTITVAYGTNVTYEVAKTGYTTVTDSIVVTEDTTLNINIIRYTLSVNPTPSTATVVLTATGFEQVDNAISVAPDTEVQYQVSEMNYITESGTETVTQDTTLSITLSPAATLEIDPTPPDATVVLTATGYEQVGNVIVVATGTEVVYDVSKEGYTPASDTVTVNATQTIPVTLIAL